MCWKSLKILIVNFVCCELIFELLFFVCVFIEVWNFMMERILVLFFVYGKKLLSLSLGFVFVNGDIMKCKSVLVLGKCCKYVYW